MYNPTAISSLPPAQPGESWASLERLDGKGVFNFLVNPESEQWTHSTEFAKLPVALTPQPIVKFKYSDTTLSLPQVRLWVPGNLKSIKTVSDLLMSFTKPIKNGDDPPLLKFVYGDTLIPRCYLSKFTLTSQMKLGGNISMADASLEILIAPELPKVELAPKEDVANTVKLTEKELTEASKLVLQAFETQPKLAAEYKTDHKKDTYGVTADKQVLINGKPVGTLEKILGGNMPQKWLSVKTNTTPSTPKPAGDVM